MTHRYFVEQPIEGDEARLIDAEAHHLTHVMRLRVGDEVTLFDGGGDEFVGKIEKIGRGEVRLAVPARKTVDRELRRSVTLASALPRGDRQKWLIEKATELGVRRFVPLRTKRAVVQPDEGACARLRRAVIEASKQCGRNRLMEIGAPREVTEFAAGFDAESLRILAQPDANDTLTSVAAELQTSPLRSIALLVGPEGGFTTDEEAAARSAGWRGIHLGPRILRIETAATALCAWAAEQER